MSKSDRRSGENRRQRQDFVFYDLRRVEERRSTSDRRRTHVDVEIDMRVVI